MSRLKGVSVTSIAQLTLARRTLAGRVTAFREVSTTIVSGTRIRPNGVDGPETPTRYGRVARAFMAGIVQGETVTCFLNGERTYDRWVGGLLPERGWHRDDRDRWQLCSRKVSPLRRGVSRPRDPAGALPPRPCFLLQMRLSGRRGRVA